MLQWDLGTETATISQVAEQVGTKVFMRTSTCTNDVAVIAFQTTAPTAGTAHAQKTGRVSGATSLINQICLDSCSANLAEYKFGAPYGESWIRKGWILLAIIANSDLRHGLELDCNQEATLVRGARPLIYFNSISI